MMREQPSANKKAGVAMPKDELGRVRGAQHRDPASGKPEIEAVMAYREAPPPPPRAKKSTVTKPLPWKIKEMHATKEAKASLARTQEAMWTAIREQQKAHKPEDDMSPSEINAKLQSELPNGPIPVTNGPAGMGSVRVIKRDQTTPFSRDVPAAAQATTAVKPIGNNFPPPDGKKHMVPLLGHDAATDVIAFRPKPVAPPPQTSTGPEVDILGRPVSAFPPKKKPEPAAEDIKRENDHFKKVMGGDRHVLADIAREKALHRVPEVDPKTKLDIFGKRILEHHHNIPRQSMFPGDQEPVQLFNNGHGPYVPLSDKARDAMLSFPSYIGNPQGPGPTIAQDRVALGGREGGSSRGPQQRQASREATASPTNQHTDFSVPGLGVSKKAAPPSFYASSVYQKILIGCGLWGLRPLRQALRAMDKNNDGILSRSEFANACLKTSLDFLEPEITALMQLAPPNVATPEGKPSLIPPKPDFPAFVLIPTLLDALRGGDMPVRRRQVAAASFQKLCTLARKQTFGLSLEDIMNTTDFSAHPQFAPHIKGSLREIMQAFSSAWGEKKSRTSVISEEEFVGFYHDFSPLIKNDNEYVRVMKGLHSL